MSEIYNLDRFLKMQEMKYTWALKEIINGRKESHWIWFIFPQLRALGKSQMALYYGIEDLREAKAYIEHPVLGSRLRDISAVLLTLDTNDPLAVMGHPDHLKLCSCMTLFMHATEDSWVFKAVLEKYYGGEPDRRTLEILGKG